MRIYCKSGFLLLVSIHIGLICSRAEAADRPLPPITVISVSSPSIVYNTGRDGCDQWDVPDMTPHAFRDPSGVIHFFATGSINHAINREMLGADFGHLRHMCDIAFKGSVDKNPAAYDDNGWLSVTYATGNTVYAVIHNEWHGNDENTTLCPSKSSSCNETSLSAAISTDSGYHFERYPGPKGLIAAAPYPYQMRNHAFGVAGGASNIIKRGDYFYLLASEIDAVDKRYNGICVMRTNNLSDPSSWRGWDGNDYTVDFINPYRSNVDNPTAHKCIPLPDGRPFFSTGSVTWSTRRQSYIMVARVQSWDAAKYKTQAGLYLFESANLIDWSAPILLLSDAQAGDIPQDYPALIDPHSSDQNFSTIGDSPILFTKVSTKGDGYKSWQVIARQVKLDGL